MHIMLPVVKELRQFWGASFGMAARKAESLKQWRAMFKPWRASSAARASPYGFDGRLVAGGVDVSAEYKQLLVLEQKCAAAADSVHDLRTRSGSFDAAESEDEDVVLERFRRHASSVALRCGFSAWFPPETADEGDDRPGNYAKNALLARCRKDVAFLLNVGHRLPLSSDLWKLCVSCALPLKDLGYRGWRLQVALLGDDRAFVCIDGSYPFPVHPTL